MSAPQYPVPPTPRVISPSPTPSETSGKDGYFSRNGTKPPAGSSTVDAEDPAFSRARSRSRSPAVAKKGSTKVDGLTPIQEGSGASATSGLPTKRKSDKTLKKKESGGLLKPASAGFGRDYWRALSRSPSPLGLIPIHREWRTFIHKHEIPRKALHVSIGFFALLGYTRGYQKEDIHPVLLKLFIPIFLTDLFRMQYAPFNRFYIGVLGAFMRESEAHDKYNGVIFYLAGAWAVMRFCSKDIAVLALLLLSWCDTAASTFGRLYGRYTPRVAKNKSLAGSLAACIVGVLAAYIFYALIAPLAPAEWNTGPNKFAFTGQLSLPLPIRQKLDVSKAQVTITDASALAVMCIVSGLAASVGEAFDLAGLDDNFTIPVLSGTAIAAFLNIFR